MNYYSYWMQQGRVVCEYYATHTEYDEDHITVTPVTTAEYGASKAARPFNSRLDKSKLIQAGFTPLPDWKDALQRYLTEILNEEF